MDYVRDGDIQGRSFVFLEVHCPSILPSLTYIVHSGIVKTCDEVIVDIFCFDFENTLFLENNFM